MVIKRIFEALLGSSDSAFEGYYSSLLRNVSRESAPTASEARKDYADGLSWRSSLCSMQTLR